MNNEKFLDITFDYYQYAKTQTPVEIENTYLSGITSIVKKKITEIFKTCLDELKVSNYEILLEEIKDRFEKIFRVIIRLPHQYFESEPYHETEEEEKLFKKTKAVYFGLFNEENTCIEFFLKPLFHTAYNQVILNSLGLSVEPEMTNLQDPLKENILNKLTTIETERIQLIVGLDFKNQIYINRKIYLKSFINNFSDAINHINKSKEFEPIINECVDNFFENFLILPSINKYENNEIKLDTLSLIFNNNNNFDKIIKITDGKDIVYFPISRAINYFYDIFVKAFTYVIQSYLDIYNFPFLKDKLYLHFPNLIENPEAALPSELISIISRLAKKVDKPKMHKIFQVNSDFGTDDNTGHATCIIFDFLKNNDKVFCDIYHYNPHGHDTGVHKKMDIFLNNLKQQIENINSVEISVRIFKDIDTSSFDSLQFFMSLPYCSGFVNIWKQNVNYIVKKCISQNVNYKPFYNWVDMVEKCLLTKFRSFYSEKEKAFFIILQNLFHKQFVDISKIINSYKQLFEEAKIIKKDFNELPQIEDWESLIANAKFSLENINYISMRGMIVFAKEEPEKQNHYKNLYDTENQILEREILENPILGSNHNEEIKDKSLDEYYQEIKQKSDSYMFVKNTEKLVSSQLCEKDSDCPKTFRCVNKKCKVKEHGLCENDDHCDYGFYCKDNLCTEEKDDNSKRKSPSYFKHQNINQQYRECYNDDDCANKQECCRYNDNLERNICVNCKKYKSTI